MWDFFGTITVIFTSIIFLLGLIFTWVFATAFVIAVIYSIFVYDYKSWTKSFDNYAFTGFGFIFGWLMIVTIYAIHAFFWDMLSINFQILFN
jgi:hypothetical protein